jgi:hypothetical protein
MRCAMGGHFTIPTSSPMPGTVSRSVLRILDCSLLLLKDCCYRVVGDTHSFIYLSQIAPLPLGFVYSRWVDNCLLHCF